MALLANTYEGTQSEVERRTANSLILENGILLYRIEISIENYVP